eukprot:TRINITY_DN20424_c0_g1_i1.p1 TRINITY_DN20424_c0_g1~~TRINITY_DN20424_c0_g1_i1.p1  ORF type:complete len:1237 (+),score=483.05 TRINITY_DN20424_c0_g1_i1:82-3711(+)
MNEDDILLSLFRTEERRSAAAVGSGRRAMKRGAGVGIPSHYLNCLSSPSYYQYTPSTASAPAYSTTPSTAARLRSGYAGYDLAGRGAAAAVGRSPPAASDVHSMFKGAGLDLAARSRTPTSKAAQGRAASASAQRAWEGAADLAAATPKSARSASADTPGTRGPASCSSTPAARPQEPQRSPQDERASSEYSYSPGLSSRRAAAAASPYTAGTCATSAAEEIDRSDSGEAAGRAREAIDATMADMAALGPSEKFKRSVERLLAAVSTPPRPAAAAPLPDIETVERQLEFPADLEKDGSTQNHAPPFAARPGEGAEGDAPLPAAAPAAARHHADPAMMADVGDCEGHEEAVEEDMDVEEEEEEEEAVEAEPLACATAAVRDDEGEGFLDPDSELLARDLGVYGLSEFDASLHSAATPRGTDLDATATTAEETPESAAAAPAAAPDATPLRSGGSSDVSQVTTPLSTFMHKQGHAASMPRAARTAERDRVMQTPSTAFSKPPEFPSPTPHKNIPSVQAELVRLVYNSVLDRDEEVRDLQLQLGRKFTLEVEAGGGDGADAEDARAARCVISKIPAPRTADGVEIIEADEPDLFRGDAAISSLVNISDGVLCRLISQQSAREGTHQLLGIASAFSQQLLRELETELRYSAPDAAAATPTSRRRDRGAAVATDALTRFAAAHPELEARVTKFAAEVARAAQHPAQHPPRHLHEVVAAVEGYLQACAAPFQGEDAGAAAAPSAAHDEDLSATLAALRTEEEAAKEAGRLDASAKLRNQQLHEQSAWLRAHLSGLPGAAAAPPAASETRGEKAAGILLCAVQHQRLSTEAQEKIAACEAAVAAQQEAHGAREAANAAAADAAAAALQRNTDQTEAVVVQIEALYKQLEGLQNDRCAIVKKRIERVGAAAIDAAAGAERIAAARRELREAGERAAFLQQMDGVLEQAQAVQTEAATACETWEARAKRSASERHGALLSAGRRVWGEYERNHQGWCGILERGVSAMEKRLVMLRRLVLDAEERYDEEDRDRTKAEIVRVTKKLEVLNGDLRDHRDAFLDTYHGVQQYVQPSPPPEATAGAMTGVSPPPPHTSPSFSSAGPDDASPGYTPSTGAKACEPVPSPSPMVQEAMAHIGLSDALQCLGRDAEVTSSWQGCLDRTDLRTMADLYRVRSVPTVWRAFLSEKPLLKSELSMLLQKHMTAATEATAHIHPPPVLTT